MAFLLTWTRIELRRRWRPLLVLALLVAVASARPPAHRAARLSVADVLRAD